MFPSLSFPIFKKGERLLGTFFEPLHLSYTWQQTGVEEHNESCFINMIDSYLLGATVSFVARQKQLPGFQKLISCAFSAPASQVTQNINGMPLKCRRLLFLLMFEGFFSFPPAQFFTFVSPFSDKSVFTDKCPL